MEKASHHTLAATVLALACVTTALADRTALADGSVGSGKRLSAEDGKPEGETTFADRIELADGSIINGRLLSAEDGRLKVATTFAGTIRIDQAEVRTFATDEAVNVALAGGATAMGKVTAEAGGIRVTSAHGVVRADISCVEAVWRDGEDDPATRKLMAEAEARKRKWAYEASVAIAGRTGAREKFGATVGFKATLASAQDKLIFALATERAEDKGIKTADRHYGGVDYSSFYSEDNGWYVRTSLEIDKIKAIDLRSSSGFGLSRRLIKNKAQDFEFRLGANYQNDSYSDGTIFESPGLDIEFLNTYKFSRAKLANQLTYTPAFKEFTNYRLRHESTLEVPVSASLWKLKLGLFNEYFSTPPAGTERLDTTYFTSLILNWQ